MSQDNKKDMRKYFYRVSAWDFKKVPGSPLAYWASDALLSTFEGDNISSVSVSNGQNKTADNDRYVRYHWEVSSFKVGLGKKWLLYAKGGEFKKWAGNLDCVVDWSKEAREHYRKDSRCRIIPEELWGAEGVTWSRVASSSTPPAFRLLPKDSTFDMVGSSVFVEDEDDRLFSLAVLNSPISKLIIPILNPTVDVQVKDVQNIPFPTLIDKELVIGNARDILSEAQEDWDANFISLGFSNLRLLINVKIQGSYCQFRSKGLDKTLSIKRLEEENNRLLIEAYGLEDELDPEVPLEEITLTCNPHYRYGGKLTDQEREDRLQSDTLAELVSYAIGCMMGRYSLDKPGLILASQGETRQDYLAQIPAPLFMPDEDAIIPLTDQEWFKDDATNLFRDFIKTAWSEEHLQENLDFVAESLCLHAVKPKKGEAALETIRRYLSTQFYKDHLKTYKKRPIYWLFSSGKQKAFECLVYLHRYNEGTLSRMRTEYVTPLLGKYDAWAEQLEKQLDSATSTAEANRFKKELASLQKKQVELREFDDKLKHYADMRISLDLDDGVKVNYGKFGDLLANVKEVTGSLPSIK